MHEFAVFEGVILARPCLPDGGSVLVESCRSPIEFTSWDLSLNIIGVDAREQLINNFRLRACELRF